MRVIRDLGLILENWDAQFTDGNGWWLTTAPVTKAVGVGRSRRYCNTGPGMTSLKDEDLQRSSALAQSSMEI